MRALPFAVAIALAACAMPEDERPAPIAAPRPMVGVPGPAPAPLPATASQSPEASPMPTAPRTIAAEPSEAPRAHRSGRRIDLDVKDADIHDVCRMLADVGGVNIVVADDVHGAVTIKMRRVPWDQALDVILRAKGLEASWEDSVVLVTAKAR